MMKIKIYFFFFFYCLNFQITAQIIKDVKSCNLEKYLDSFILKTEVKEKLKGEYACLLDVENDTIYRKYNYHKIRSKSPKLLIVFATIIPSYHHILISFEKHLYLVNMRNPLDSILAELSHLGFPSEFDTMCRATIKNVHRRNWYEGQDIRQSFIIDENGLWQEIEYDPNKNF